MILGLPFWGIAVGFRGTPSPSPSGSLDWRGVCKNALYNLENNELRRPSEILALTASALTMVCSFYFVVKVRYHKRALEAFGHRGSLGCK